MDEANTVLERYDSAADDGILTNPGEAVPKVLDPIVTMEVVQRYVETERNRTRRIMLWIGTVFLIVALLILTMFVSIGIFVLRNSRKATDIVDEIQARTAIFAAEATGISNRIAEIEDEHSRMRDAVEDRAMVRITERKSLQSDLERFGKWIGLNNMADLKKVEAVEARLRQIEEATAVRESELAGVMEQYSNLLASVSVGSEGDLESRKERPEKRDEAPVMEVADVSAGEAVHAFADLSAELPGDEAEIVATIATGGPAAKAAGEMAIVAFPNGDRYEGEFRNGLFDGWGVYSYHNGDRYEGEFKNDLRHGTGSMIYGNGNRYTGLFEKGLRHGNGVFSFSNGDVYKGEFREDTRHGRGTYIFAEGGRYIGDFRNGKRHGNGRYVYRGGEEYIGQFKDGKKDGIGVSLYPNGKQFKGLWKDDKVLKALDG